MKILLKEIKKLATILVFACAFSGYTKAQTTDIHIQKLNEIVNIPLVVVLLDENPLVLEKLSVASDTSAIVKYKYFINNYNQNIKEVVLNRWKLNKKIAFFSSKQLENFPKENRIALLKFGDLEKINWQETQFSNLTFPSLSLSIFNDTIVSATFPFPYYGFQPTETPVTRDFYTAVSCLQNLVKDELREQKNYNSLFYNYIIDSHDKYCYLLRTKKLILDYTTLDKGIVKEDIDEKYKYSIVYLPAQEVSGIVKKNDVKYAYVSLIPYKRKKQKRSNFDSMVNTISNPNSLSILKVIIDVETGNILSYSDTEESLVNLKDFIRFNNCKL